MSKWWIVITALVMFFGFVLISFADTFTYKEIALAIERVENSTKFPFGIQSIDTKGNRDYAYKLCLQSIHNAHKRWIEASKPGDFLESMAKRYCPPNWGHWAYMVKYWLVRNREEVE